MANQNPIRAVILGGLFLFALSPVRAQETTGPTAPGVTPGPTFGHSMRGEEFNEGPRQKAYLMKGMAKIVFQVTTKSQQAQRFFEQGVAQLHAYWYFEAERSFRQAAALDPDCAMAYWGMAMANLGNEKRAKSFCAKAMERRSKVSERERLWIENLNAFLTADPKMNDREKTRRIAYITGLQKLSESNPNDLEAKAFYAHELLDYRDVLPKVTREDVEKLLNAILAVNPEHPVHHYRIHLWDDGSGKALNSAAMCGITEQGIAHMWHMPGHTYTGLKRYADAAYYQEASARVDHARQMHDRVLPDQIHNYAHNNQWLVETLEFVGRVHDAIDLAKNMVELPRHPKYNQIVGSGSAGSGRSRLLETLTRYELWQEALALDAQGYIEPTTQTFHQIERLKLLAVASFATNDLTGGRKYLAQLQALQPAPKPGADTSENEGPPSLGAALAEAQTYEAIALGKFEEAAKRLEKTNVANERKARLCLAMGKKEQAETLAREAAKNSPNQVAVLATLVDVLYEAGKRDEAKTQFAELRKLAARANLDVPLFAKLTPIAQEFGCSGDWRTAVPPAPDTGKRPRLDTLGPFRWSPMPAPDFTLRASTGEKVSLAGYLKQGKPVLLIFYLGSGCLQCQEQLKTFAPMTAEFEKAGISLVGISTDTVAGLQRAFPANNPTERFPFPLLSDKDFKVFKAFRAYDDFEQMPLHGVFLIDPQGKVRWQDISFEPFKQADFLLTEAKRLLAQGKG